MSCFIKIAVLEAPIKWNNDNTPVPTELTGPSLILVSIVAAILALGKAALIAGNIILLHSSSVKVHAGNGYFNLALMFVRRAV